MTKSTNPPAPTLTLILHVCDVILLFPFVPKNYDQIPVQNIGKINSGIPNTQCTSTILQSFITYFKYLVPL